MSSQITNSPVDNLEAGSFQQITKVVTLLTGTNYKRGDVLEINADGKAIIVTDETKAKYILAVDTDATSGDMEALVYTTGQFHTDECNLNGKDETAIIDALHIRSIFLK